MRLVLDTSVVVSAVRNPYGVSADLLERALRREFSPLISTTLMCEYEDVLKRPEQRAYSGFTVAQIDDLLGALTLAGEEVEMGPYIDPASPDPDDTHVLRLAKYGKADAIVTYNTRHFSTPARELGVDLLTAAEFLRIWRERHVGNDR